MSTFHIVQIWLSSQKAFLIKTDGRNSGRRRLSKDRVERQAVVLNKTSESV